MFLPYGNSLRCVRARRSARRAAKSDAAPSVERRNEAGARPHATRRAGRFCVVGSSKGSRVVPATRLRPSPAHGRKIAPAQAVPYGGEHALGRGLPRFFPPLRPACRPPPFSLYPAPLNRVRSRGPGFGRVAHGGRPSRTNARKADLPADACRSQKRKDQATWLFTSTC